MRLFLIFLGLLGFFSLSAQPSKPPGYVVQPQYQPPPPQGLRLPRPPARLSLDSLGRRGLERWRREHWELGFWAFSLDSLWLQGDTLWLLADLGPRASRLYLQPGNLPNASAQVLGPSALAAQANQYLDQAAQRGYPFAQLRLDSLQWRSETELSAQWQWQAGPLIRFSGLELPPTEEGKKLRTRRSYLEQYLQIRPAQLYDERKVKRLEKRLRELPFVRMTRPPQVLFQGEEAQVLLFLRDQPSSQFDVLLGLLPNSDPLNAQVRRFNLTGNVLIDLHHSFGRGERLKLWWQQLRLGTSAFQVLLQFPYLFKSPFGATGQLDIYRRDSAYVDVTAQATALYALDGSQQLGLRWRSFQTNLIKVDTAQVRSTRQLPRILDVRQQSFGLFYQIQRLDEPLLPRRGWSLQAEGFWARRRILPNVQIAQMPVTSDFQPARLYDTTAQASTQYRLSLEANVYQPLNTYFIVKATGRFGGLYSRNLLLINELFRLGGLRNLRGFDEESLFAAQHGALSAELQWRFGADTYFFGFVESAWLANPVQGPRHRYFSSGGLGLVLNTRVGLFSFTYALGQQWGLPLVLRNAKVHFGYLTRF